MCQCWVIPVIWAQVVFCAVLNNGMTATVTLDRSGLEESNDSVVKMDAEPLPRSVLVNVALPDSPDSPRTRHNSRPPSVGRAAPHPMSADTEPVIRGLGFEPKARESPEEPVGGAPSSGESGRHEPGGDTPEDDDDDDDGGGHLVHLIALLAGSFLGGIFVSTAVGLTIYIYKRKRWKDRNITIEADMSRPKLANVSSFIENETDSAEISQCSSDSLMRDERYPAADAEGSLLSVTPPPPDTLGGSFPGIEMSPTLPEVTFIHCAGVPLLPGDDSGLTHAASPAGPGVNASQPKLSAAGAAGDPSYITADDKPYITRFAGLITDEGGAIQSPDSDVCVIIPPGAVERQSGGVNLGVRVTVSDKSRSMPPTTALGCSRIPLGPVVDLSCAGVECFTRPVIVKIPHRAYLGEDPPCSSAAGGENRLFIAAPPTGLSPWRLELHSSHRPRHYPPPSSPSTENNPRWCPAPHLEGTHPPPRPVCFSFDKDFVFVHTTRPAVALAATGCVHSTPKEDPPVRLKLSALTFASYAPVSGVGGPGPARRWQAALRLYICDGFADAHKRVLQTEKDIGGYRQSPDKHLLISYGSDVKVLLSDADNASWTWKLDNNCSTTKTITWSSMCEAGVPPLCVEFPCTSRQCSERRPPLQTSFSLLSTSGGQASPLGRVLVRDNFAS